MRNATLHGMPAMIDATLSSNLPYSGEVKSGWHPDPEEALKNEHHGAMALQSDAEWFPHCCGFVM